MEAKGYEIHIKGRESVRSAATYRAAVTLAHELAAETGREARVYDLSLGPYEPAVLKIEGGI